TLVLVTHDMSTVQAFCDRAMLIHDGELRYLGDPEEAALRYYRLNFANGGAASGAGPGGVPDVNVRLVDVWLQDDAGRRVENVEQGRPFGLNLVLEARHDLERPVFQLHVVNADGVWVFGFDKRIAPAGAGPALVRAGQRVRIAGRIENPLVPGRYHLDCWTARERDEGDLALHALKLLDFFVYGAHPGAGSVAARAELEAVLEP
ncbi:MAG TPA: Wzt carbohydrate-binding domain-containing protein, partial [Solirubrobacteraceae bacterium]|nr:Wzt carbohydrate-binding domain-containing protein [Solirubrobacteraceae bacterium]